MRTFTTKIAAICTALMMGAGSAAALPLAPGDDFNLQFQDDGIALSNFNGTVGAGTDVSPYGGALQVDLNTGVGGDEFTVTSAGSYCGLICNGSAATMLFTGLDFGTDFIVSDFTDTTGLGAIFTVLSPTSFSITWTDPVGAATSFQPGVVAFSGRFIEAPVVVTAVPLPASAPLALLGLTALIGVGRRRR